MRTTSFCLNLNLFPYKAIWILFAGTLAVWSLAKFNPDNLWSDSRRWIFNKSLNLIALLVRPKLNVDDQKSRKTRENFPLFSFFSRSSIFCSSTLKKRARNFKIKCETISSSVVERLKMKTVRQRKIFLRESWNRFGENSRKIHSRSFFIHYQFRWKVFSPTSEARCFRRWS